MPCCHLTCQSDVSPQTEAERDRLAEAARRRSDRQLRHQLECSSQRQLELEQLVRRLSSQLRQLPAAGGEAAAAAEQRVWRAEQQLLELGRQRLQLQADVIRLRSRARLLHSQERVHGSQQAEAAVQPGRQQRHQQSRRQSGSSSSAAGAGSRRAVRELTQQLEKAQAQIDRMRITAQQYDGALDPYKLFFFLF